MKIRNINQKDSKDLFEWRNNYESRKMSFGTKKITLEEHEKWFKESIKNPNKNFYIGEYNGIKIGVCRFGFDKKKNISETSININPDERGKGYGKKLLTNAIKTYLKNKSCTLIAKIKEDNIISIKLFNSAGFLVSKKDQGTIYMELKNELIFKKIDSKDALILYDLLKKRNYNISHEVLPDFKSHKKFVENNPYLYWYIFYLNDKAIGTFYIKDDNSVGINTNKPNEKIINQILDFILDNFSPREGIPSEIPNYFFVNVSQNNNVLKDIVMSLGYLPIQVSYKLIRN